MDFIDDFSEVLRKNSYELPTERLFEKVANILIRPDSRYYNNEAQYLVACFIQNNAVVIQKIKLDKIKIPDKLPN